MARAVDDSWDPNDLGVLKRLEALLALWIHPPYWRPLDERYHDGLPSHGAPELLSEEEESIWERFLVDARVHEPASTIGGLRRALRTRKVSAKEHPVRALSSNGGITFVEGRVAVKRASAMSPFGRSWFLSAPWSTELEEVANKKAEHVERCGDQLLAAYPKSKRDRFTRLVITALAERARSDADLLDAYFKATAMDIADAVVDAISTVQRTRLGALLGGILRRSCARLHWTVDLRLGMFELHARNVGGGDVRGHEISRVGALFEAYRALERVGSYWGISALVEDYYESIARGFALAGEVGELGNTLSVLPAGRTLLVIAQRLVEYRPTVLAALLSHPSWAPEAAFCLSQFLRRHRHHSFRDLDLLDEWQEVQVITRRRLLDRPAVEKPDISASVDLAIRDEATEETARHAPSRFTSEALSSEGRERVFEYWRATLKRKEHVSALVMEVERRISDAPTLGLPLAASALRFSSLLEASGEPDAARRIAGTMVRSYAASAARVTTDGVLDLSHRGDLLRALAILAPGDTAWSLWLRPFDVEAILDEALREQNSDDAQRRVQFAGPRALLRHARNLLAMSAESEPATRKALVEAVASIAFAERERSLHVRAFAGHDDWLWGVPGEPILVSIARGLATPDVDGVATIRAFMRARPSLIEAAQWAWGIGSGHVLFSEIVGHVKDLAASADLSTFRIGESMTAALALFHCGLYGEAERFARSTLDTAHAIRPGMLHTAELSSIRVLLACLAERAAWDEILAYSYDADLPPDWVAVIANWRAVAFMKKGELPSAHEELRRVLRVAPKNTMARGNLLVAYSSEARWQDVEELLEDESLVLDDVPDDVRRVAGRALADRGAIAAAHRLLDGVPPGPVPPDTRLMQPITDFDMTPSLPEQEETLLDGIVEACARLAREPTLFDGRKEDEITAILDIALSGLPSDYQVNRGQPQGRGKKKGQPGITDLTIREAATGRVVVTGEAKRWKGKEWATAGVRQALGTTSRTEAFLLVLLYCDDGALSDCTAKTSKLVADFAVRDGARTLYATQGAPENRTPPHYGSFIQVLRSVHRIRPEDAENVVIYTVLLDLAHDTGRAARKAR